MRRLLFGILLAGIFALPAAAQTTQVTGTITDLSGLPYAGAQVSAQLVFAGVPVSNPTVTISVLAQCRANGFGSAPCQVPFNPSNGPFTLDGSGNIPAGGITLQDNTLVTPAGTQWILKVNENGTPPPLGTGPQVCTGTTTVSGASVSITSLFNACPALATGNLNSLNVTGVTLSQTCGKTIAPCIQIPPPGGCFNGPNPQGGTGPATSASSGVITFSSTYPSNPPPQVGQLAWVMQTTPQSSANPQNFCNTGYNSFIESLSYAEAVLCGKTVTGGGTPITITSVNPAGLSLTVSQNCNSTQNGTNATFFYGPNIYSQMVTACQGPNGAGGTNVHVAQGVYALDNTGNGTVSACGCVQIGCSPFYFFGSLSGEGVFGTQIYTPPWYNHGGDLGTVLAGGQIHDIMFGGGWVSLAVSINRGTFYDGNPCGSHDAAIIGYNLASNNAATTETMYPATSNSINGGACELHNLTIASGDSGLVTSGGQNTIANSVIITRNPTFICPFTGASNGTFRINGGFYSSAGRNRAGSNAGVVACPSDGAAPTGDKFIFDNADVCMTAGTNIPAINLVESAGALQFNNSTVNNSPLCAPGANSGGVTVASGISVQAQQTKLAATGTGNSLVIPSGASYTDDCGNTVSGGAGTSIAGSVFGSCSITGALVTGNIGLTSGWGASTVASVAAGSDSHQGRFTVTGAAGAASPTITLTFPTPYLVAPARCNLIETGANDFASLSNPTAAAASTTSVVFTLAGTPVAVTYQFDYVCGP